MISSNDFKTGVSVELDGVPYVVVEFQHVKPGKGAAFVRTKLKNMKTGSTTERNFNGGEKMPKANLERRTMQYLYNDAGDYVFMDNETYDQMNIRTEAMGDKLKYLKENMELVVLFFKGDILGVDFPSSVELTVIETEPGIKGDTSSGGTKTAVGDTGANIRVPFFINEGDVVRINTETGEYIERVNK